MDSQHKASSAFESLELLDTATEIAKWEAEEREKEEEKERKLEEEREEKARQKREQKLEFAPVPAAPVQKSENVAQLYLMAQKRNLTPIFDFENVDMHTFRAILKLHDATFTAYGPFSSKKEAKEAAAKFGVDYLNSNLTLANALPGATSGSRAAVNVAELTILAQKQKIPLPEYVFAESHPQEFSVIMTLDGTTFKQQGPFSSKKQAKEAVAKLGVIYLKQRATPTLNGSTSVELMKKFQSLVDKYRLDQPIFDYPEVLEVPHQFRARLKVDGELFEEPGPFSSREEARYSIMLKGIDYLKNKLDDDDGLDWVSQLNAFAQQAHITPKYDDYREQATNQDLWASTVSIPQRPEPFGNSSEPFPSKKKAHQNAAREAMEWLREQNLVTEDERSLKKQKMDSGSDSDTVSAAKRVNDLCLLHSIPAPSYDILPVRQGEALYAGSACFKAFPLIGNGGPIGHVDMIYGQRRAKEEVAKNVLRILHGYVSELERLDREVLKGLGFHSSGKMRLEDVPLDS